MMRVLAQLGQVFFEIPFLPPFEAWHSAVVPYWMLLLVQILMVIVMIRVVSRISANRARPGRRVALLWLVLGLIYFLSMAARLALGLTVLSSHFWFSSYLPTAFHLVLATFVVVVGMRYRKLRAESVSSGNTAI